MRTDQGDGVPARGRDTWLAQWAGDLRLGVRLAIGGGRTSKTGMARLVLGTIGIGLAVAVLLIAASAGPLFDARTARQYAQVALSNPVAGVDPLYLRYAGTEYRGELIGGDYVKAGGPRHPMPPGLSQLPGDGEMVVSPALADLLTSPEGELLRPRFPQRVIGTIGRAGLVDPTTLSFYAGDSGIDPISAQPAYAFGSPRKAPLPIELGVLISVGTVVLLVPVFVFIAMSARIAGAERDRRLAALRLVGADTRQVRRIAAAESLAGAMTGLAFGVGLFLLFRTVVGQLPILGVRPFPEDVTPPWPLVLLILLTVPGLAVITAMGAMRRTIIEPLGVVRRSRPVRRKLWWRLAPVVVGAALIFSQGDVSSGMSNWAPTVVTGAALLLIGIPVLLPWLLERAVARLRGGRPATQLAVRRLQLDSGTPARVVSGVAVVLAGAIALQVVLAAQTSRFDVRAAQVGLVAPELLVDVDDIDPAELAGKLARVPGLRSTFVAGNSVMRTDDGVLFNVLVADCAMLLRSGAVDACADGQVFSGPSKMVDPGHVVTVGRPTGENQVDGVSWTTPPVDRLADSAAWSLMYRFGPLVITPGALPGRWVPTQSAVAVIVSDPDHPDAAELVRNAVAPYGWRASVSTSVTAHQPGTRELFLTIRGALLGGALFILLLAGVSMLVLALEQVRERRRPLAALAAAGIPTGTLARSLLWQNAIPVLVGVVLAVLTGIGLAALVFRLLRAEFTMNWGAVALFSGAAAVLVLLVTVLTLPTLRSATRLAALRSE